MNMSHCRFENTLSDLRDCEENIEDTEELNQYELAARKQLIEVCKRIAQKYSEPTRDKN